MSDSAATIPALFTRQADALSQRPLFLVRREGAYRPISWAQASRDVQALSAWLLEQGLAPGDRVVILSENRPEWAIADLAVLAVGAWTVPLYPTLTEDDLRTICHDCQPAACVASTPEQAAKLLTGCRGLECLRAVIVMDPSAAPPTAVIAWAAALAQGARRQDALRDELDRRRGRIRPEDTATLIYTSGTTGEPKGVMLSHRNFLSNVEASLEVTPLGDQDLHLSFLPLSHVFERMAGWYLMLAAGACVAYAQSMDTIGEDMIAARPTIMLGVPRFFEKLYLKIQEGIKQAPPAKRRLAAWALRVGADVAAHRMTGRPVPALLGLQHRLASLLVFKKLQGHLGGRLRFFVSGSAPLSKTVGEFFYSVGVTILEGYGLTETSPVIAVNRLPVPRFGSVGPLLPGVEVRIAADGEILTKGPHVMQGYYRKPEATAEVIVDGWFHTGDIGRLDADGFLHITDRKKDLIKTAGGKFVAPQKLENLFVTDPHISQAFVYGDKRPYCVALIVPDVARLRRYVQEQEIAAGSAQELVRHPAVREFYWGLVQAKQQGLAPFEQVKKIALLSEEFSQAAGELTPTLKAKRGMILQRYQAVLDGLYESAPA